MWNRYLPLVSGGDASLCEANSQANVGFAGSSGDRMAATFGDRERGIAAEVTGLTAKWFGPHFVQPPLTTH